MKYVVLLRGINVGGKNKVPMSELKKCLEDLDFTDVSTYIASGNALITSDQTSAEIKHQIETMLPRCFKLDSELIKVLVLTHAQLQAVVDNKPTGFGEQPDTYHSDVIFLMDIGADAALAVFNPKEGVDTIWPGDGVIYSQRLSALRTKSRLSKIMMSPLYKSMTIRTYGTVTKLLSLLDHS
jgi:uncharacterized protein (DUF1697 family)